MHRQISRLSRLRKPAFRLSALLCGFVLIVGFMANPAGRLPAAYAQDITSETPPEAMADLYISVSHGYDVYASLRLEADSNSRIEQLSDEEKISISEDPLSREDAESVGVTAEVLNGVRAVLSCQGSRLETYYYYGQVEISGTCPALAREKRQWHGQTDIAPLADTLAENQIERLLVTISLPLMGSSQFSPPAEDPFAAQGIAGGWLNKIAGVPAYGTYTIDTQNPAVTQIAFSYGFSDRQVAFSAAALLSVLLIPIGIGGWLRSRALKVHQKNSEAHIWFGYQRSTTWLDALTWIAWITVFMATSASDWLFVGLAAGPESQWIDQLTLLPLFLPPLFIGAINRCFYHQVMAKVAQMDYRLWEVLVQYVASQSIFVFGLLAISLLPWAIGGSTAGKIALVVVVLGFILALKGARAMRDWTPHSVTTGELRDRIFALAEPNGVKLSQLYVLPMKRSRMVNAFALKNNTVMITDYLLKHLTKDEVDGIMAHELAHLQLGHTRKLGWCMFVAVLIGLWLMQMGFGLLALFVPWALGLHAPIAIIVGYAVFYAVSREFEYEADAQAVVVTRDPRSLISGLVKVAQLNQMPLQWGKLGESLMTHPSMQRRVDALVRTYNLPEDDIQSLVQQTLNASDEATADEDKYSPETWQEGNEQALIFSSAEKQKLNNRVIFLALGCLIGWPIILGRLVNLLPTPGLQWLGYSIAAIAVIVTYLTILNFSAVWGYRQFKEKLAKQLAAAGIDVSQGTFIGFSPEAELKNYEGCSNWDIGFLFLAGQRLCYIGEQVRFALKFDQITQTTVEIDPGSMLNQADLSLTWQNEDLSAHTVRFQMLDTTSVKATLGLARSLQAQIENWQTTQTQTAHIQTTQTQTAHIQTTEQDKVSKPFNQLQFPNIGEVTSQPLLTFSLPATFTNIIVLTVLSLICAAITGSLFISGSLTAFILCMSIAGGILQMVPALRRQTLTKTKKLAK